jgi:hypothetical protein
MKKRFGEAIFNFMLATLILSIGLPAWGYDLTDKFSIGGVMSGA